MPSTLEFNMSSFSQILISLIGAAILGVVFVLSINSGRGRILGIYVYKDKNKLSFLGYLCFVFALIAWFLYKAYQVSAYH